MADRFQWEFTLGCDPMRLTLNRENALIFRITHVDNVPWILEHGMHARNGAKFDPNYRNIGNVELIDKRARREVAVPPGGTLSDYVPFYFTPYSIMMLNIHTRYGGLPQVPNEEIVIFVSSLHHAAKQGCSLVFTNQHAYPPMAEYFTDLGQLDAVDWPLLQSRNFKHDPDDPGKKERYQAEALIWQHVPLGALKGVCCFTTSVERRIKDEVEKRSLTFTVATQRSWYF
jgi:ssDNA thymidine ADP-ribosyltransferase, DarT